MKYRTSTKTFHVFAVNNKNLCASTVFFNETMKCSVFRLSTSNSSRCVPTQRFTKFSDNRNNIQQLYTKQDNGANTMNMKNIRTHASFREPFQKEINYSANWKLWAALCAAGLGFLWEFIHIKEAWAKDDKDPNLPKEFLDILQKLLGDRCSVAWETREYHGRDFSINKASAPSAVVFPNNADEVSKIVAACYQYNVPIVPFGSGTSLEGHVTATHGGVCISFANMNQIIKIHENDMDCVVQPGVTYERLNEELEKYGLYFPLDPGPGASIGGMVSTCCSGPSAVRYGTMRENVISLKVVLPDSKGTVIKTRNRTRKSSAGYDLTRLFVGAEGTLGVVTEITLKLQHIPKEKMIAVCQFPTVESAANTVVQTMQSGIQIGKAEMLDDVMMKAVNQSAGFEYEEKPTLFFEFSGASKEELQRQQSIVAKISQSNGGGTFKFASDKEERDNLWFARKTALYSAPSLQPGASTKITDVCVPLSNFPQCIKETKDDLLRSKLLAPIGDGNFHLFMLIDPANPKQVNAAHWVDKRLIERAIRMEGTCTGEHGIGAGKREYLRMELGENTVEFMRLLKNSIDAKGIMNPGKVLPDRK